MKPKLGFYLLYVFFMLFAQLAYYHQVLLDNTFARMTPRNLAMADDVYRYASNGVFLAGVFLWLMRLLALMSAIAALKYRFIGTVAFFVLLLLILLDVVISPMMAIWGLLM